jgi:hypothetical protein
MDKVSPAEQARLLKLHLDFWRNIAFSIGGGAGLVFFISQGTGYFPHWLTLLLEGAVGAACVHYAAAAHTLWFLEAKGRSPRRKWLIGSGWYVAYVIVFSVRVILEARNH